MSDITPEPLSPPERRLLDLLSLLGADDATGGPRLTRSIVRSARFERHVVVVATLLGSIAGAAVEGIGALLGIRTHADRG